MKTFMAKPNDIERKWFVVDATNIPLGRLASTIVNLLNGKDKVIYTPHVDCGDFVVVINSDKIKLTGKKLEDKKLIWHTGYVGGLKEVNYKTLTQKDLTRALKQAVKGMLQKNSLGRKQITRLKIFKGAEHNHEAQKPEVITMKGAKQ